MTMNASHLKSGFSTDKHVLMIKDDRTSGIYRQKQAFRLYITRRDVQSGPSLKS